VHKWYIDKFHLAQQRQKPQGKVFTRFYSRGALAGGLAGGQIWVRFGSNNVRIRSKTRVQDAEPS
jgi:hypothetical protein